jgi:mono/diheme cytochrome c family protein
MSLALSACSPEHATPSVKDYGHVEVPQARLSSDAARQRGRLIYERKCQLCHGERADGNGVRSKGLSRRPADFTSAKWRSNVSPRFVFEIVSEGKRGTSMPAWPTLSEDEKWDVVAYVLSVAEDGP